LCFFYISFKLFSLTNILTLPHTHTHTHTHTIPPPLLRFCLSVFLLLRALCLSHPFLLSSDSVCFSSPQGSLSVSSSSGSVCLSFSSSPQGLFVCLSLLLFSLRLPLKILLPGLPVSKLSCNVIKIQVHDQLRFNGHQ